MPRTLKAKLVSLAWFLTAAVFARAADYPAPESGDYTIHDFHFRSGEVLPELRIHYRTLGKPRTDAQGLVRNAVLILHGTTGSGAQFIRPEFAGELFGNGQLLDAERYYLILPDGIGHGQSSKPSDKLRAHFPQYGYRDMIEAQYRLLTEGLKVNHLRLVMGTSMGGMHTWLWGETYPDFMDALLPLASLPTQISGRNRVWRREIIDAIRSDPAWLSGEYQTQPPGLRVALEVLYFMGSNPVQRQKEAPTLQKADEALDHYVTASLKTHDANDVLYALEASRDYDPGPGLEKIKPPLLAINFADDLINPPELGILEHEIKRVPHAAALVIPASERTRGHGTHTLAAVWKEQLRQFLQNTDLQSNLILPNLPIQVIEPPEKGFFSKVLDFHGIPIKAHKVVADEALYAAYGRLSLLFAGLLERQPMVISNLVAAGAELHIIGRYQVTTDLPEWQHDKGKKLAEYHGLTRDERTRGMGGLLTSCGEENLLRLADDRYRGRDICLHEFGHNIREHGIQKEVRARLDEQYRRSLAKGLWQESYAASNADEFFAELTMWYFGTHGDLRMTGPKPADGPDGLKQYDPDAYALLDDFYSGRITITTKEQVRP